MELPGTSPDHVRTELGPGLQAAGEARTLTRATLRRWSLPGLLDPVVLTVSELVSNAIKHGRPPVTLGLRRRRQTVLLEVHDEASVIAREPSMPSEDDESGRGLLIVEALAADTGVRDIAGDGKVAWARFPVAEAPRDRA